VRKGSASCFAKLNTGKVPEGDSGNNAKNLAKAGIESTGEDN